MAAVVGMQRSCVEAFGHPVERREGYFWCALCRIAYPFAFFGVEAERQRETS